MKKTIHLLYFAGLRQLTKIGTETIETEAETAQDLFFEIEKKYNLDFPKDFLKVAINENYQGFSFQLQNNDKVVFIPPVAGG